VLLDTRSLAAGARRRIARSTVGYLPHMGLIELLLIVLVVAAIAGGIAVNPLLFILLLVALVLLFTRGGFGYGRGI
jgi:hypothetical protein